MLAVWDKRKLSPEHTTNVADSSRRNSRRMLAVTTTAVTTSVSSDNNRGSPCAKGRVAESRVQKKEKNKK